MALDRFHGRLSLLPRAMPLWLVTAIAVPLSAPPAHAHIDMALESGVVRLDSATAVARGASPRTWRNAGPLAVPDRFGPGAVLRVGNVRMKVVNNGTLGNPYTTTSTDPSAEWPAASGIEYLHAITLAVGAVNPLAATAPDQRRVSYFEEWRPPTLDPVDRIYTAFDGVINGQRFVNDDHDVDFTRNPPLPRVDEDFHDGHDNDGDGQIDEDYAAYGQQEFSYVIRDDTREALNTVYNERHVPLGIEVKVRAWAYSFPNYQNFNVCEYAVTNVSGHTLDSLVIGWLVDMDAGPAQQYGYWTDDIDYPRYPGGEFVMRIGNEVGDLQDRARMQGGAPDQSHAPFPARYRRAFPDDSALCPRMPVRVNAFSVGNAHDDGGRTPGIGTFMLVDHTIGNGLTGPRRVGFRAFRSTSGFAAFAQGGLPRTDQERFQSMVTPQNIDADGLIDAPQGQRAGDYVQWCSIGPFGNVLPGQTVTATVAFGVSPGTPDLANGYPTDYQRYKDHLLGGGSLIAKYPSLALALGVQVAFEGIHESRVDVPETQTAANGGRGFHGRETGIRLPHGVNPQVITEDCGPNRPSQGDVTVTDNEYSWFDFDCSYCTGVWVNTMGGFTSQTGLFHKTWNAAAPPPNPETNVAAGYNFSDNPGRDIVAAGDKVVRLAWNNVSETTPDPLSNWLDFRGYDVWKTADWTRPAGSAGPGENDWQQVGEFRVFDFFSGSGALDPPIEHNYSRDPLTGEKQCPLVFIPEYYDPVTRLYGRTVPICLDRFDLWDRQSGTILRPDWTLPCEYDTSVAGAIPLDVDSGDLEWNAPGLPGGSWAHVFPNTGTFAIQCMRHPAQKGAVEVAEGGADSATVQILDTRDFTPASVTIRPGGLVRWDNLSDANHALQTDRGCTSGRGLIVHRTSTGDPRNFDTRFLYPIGRYQYVDHEVINGFTYFYSVTAFDSTSAGGLSTQLGGLRSAFEGEAVVPEVRIDANGRHGVWVVPNPYRGYADLRRRPSAWDLTPSSADPTGTHVDFMGLPGGTWTVRIYTVAGDLVQELHSTDAVNAAVRRPVQAGGTPRPGYNRQQDSPDDGQARWNLVSRNGQDIASGIYLFTVESAEGTQRGRFVIVR